MSFSDWLAIGAVLISLSALVLSFIRWRDSKPNIRVRCMFLMASRAKVSNGRSIFGVIAMNRGQASTTLLEARVQRRRKVGEILLGKKPKQILFNNYITEADHRIEGGSAKRYQFQHSDETTEWLNEGRLTVGLLCSHSSKVYSTKIRPALANKRTPPS